MRISGFITRLVRVLCTVALVSVGFAHRVPEVRAAEVVAAAYALPDGTLPDLCLTLPKGETGKTHHALGRICEACVIAASTVMPLPSGEIGPRFLPQKDAPHPDRARFDAPPVLLFGAAPRAPPPA